MITSIVLITLIGTLQFNSAISAAINYEPIKITVNENFNAVPGQFLPELQEPGVLHQGANFYFKPQLNLSPSYIPSHIEALLSLIQQHHHSCAKDTSKVVVEKDKLVEILKPFIYPLLDISKETQSKIVLEKENNLEIVKPIINTEEPKPVTPELLVISKAPVLPPSSFNAATVEEEVKKEESIILEESTGVFPKITEIAARPNTEPIINYREPKPSTSGLVFIPEAPVLPPLPLINIHAVEEEVKIEEPIIVDVEPKPAIQELLEIPEAPVLPSLSLHDIHAIEEEVKIEEPFIVNIEPKLAIQELVEIPEAPVLPSLSFHDISSIIEEEVKKEESIILEEPTGVFPTIPEIDVRPIEEPIFNYVEPKAIPSELVVIPEAPVLHPLTLNGFPSVVEEVKKEESIILEESTGMFPTITEIAARPNTEPNINNSEPKLSISRLVVIPEAPVLPSLSLNDIHAVEEVKIEEPLIVNVDPKPAIQELVEIPEAPVLPSLSFHDISSIIEEEVKKEESIILEEPTGVFPTIPEIDVRPIEEPIFNYVEPKAIPSELVVIPEAPVLHPLTFNGFPSVVEEEVKKEESIILEESTGMFPTITEIAARPITEPIINYGEPKPTTSGIVIIPEAPVLPPLSLSDIRVIEEEVKIEEPIMVDVEPKPATQELVEIPEAPVLPSLSFHDISSIIEEEVKKEESIILEEPTGVFPTIPEIDVRPIEEPIFNYVEPKAIPSELVVIPEAPVLHPLTFNGFPSVVEEEVKKEESIILEESTGMFPTITEIAARPITEPIINYGEPKPTTSGIVIIPEAPVLPPLSLSDIRVIEEEVKIEEPIMVDVEPKPATQELVEIPEAPVLPSLSFHDISSIIEEEVKKEESIILEEPTGEFPTIPEIDVRPIEEPIFNYVEPKAIPSELVVIPEAPVLHPLTLNGFPSVVEEEVKKEEPFIVNVEPKLAIQELEEIPEAPVLPSLSLHDISSIIEEEVKKEESIILEEPTGEFPTIPEIDVRPIEEPIFNYVEPKAIPSELVVIPEAPVLHPLTLNGFPSVVEEEVKKEEPFIVNVEPKLAIQELEEIPEAPVLPSLSLHDISSIIEEEVKKEESIILEEPTGEFPTIPEIDVRPIEEPIFNYVEPKDILSELVVIPEAPVLHPLTLNGFPSVVEEEVKKEEPFIVNVEPKPATQELVEIPEAPVLPPLSFNGISPVVEDVKIEESIKVEESTGPGQDLSIPEISARLFPEPLENNELSETAESFALENNIFPVATEEVKIEIPTLLEESIEVIPPIAEISSGPTLQESSLEITDSYVLEEVSQTNTESVVTVKEKLPPTIIAKPSNNLGVFSYVPFVSHLSNRAPKTKKLMIPKPASLERFLLKKHPFILPVTPFPKLDLNAIKSSIWGNKKLFLHSTSYAHNVVEKRIAPNMAFKKQNAPKRVKIYIRRNVPKGPS